MSQSSVAHAQTRDGHALPVLDVTHPSFALSDDAEARALLFGQYREAEQKQARTPRFLMRFMLKLAARKSLLLRSLVYPAASFLGGMSTYVMKLGEQNLVAPFNTSMDKRMAATPHLLSMRLRLQQCAKLLTEGLRPRLAENATAPLLMINIAGGPAMDSLNALILLKATEPALLLRKIRIRVLDVDVDGPTFGANALAALSVDGGALAGVDVDFEHLSYDWNDVSLLREVMRESQLRGEVVAASSEGGLFEYGSDEAVSANLDVLHQGAGLVVGSVTKANPSWVRARGFALVPRGVGGFTPLAEGAGFLVAQVEETPISDQVLLIPGKRG